MCNICFSFYQLFWGFLNTLIRHFGENVYVTNGINVKDFYFPLHLCPHYGKYAGKIIIIMMTMSVFQNFVLHFAILVYGCSKCLVVATMVSPSVQLPLTVTLQRISIACITDTKWLIHRVEHSIFQSGIVLWLSLDYLGIILVSFNP